MCPSGNPISTFSSIHKTEVLNRRSEQNPKLCYLHYASGNSVKNNSLPSNVGGVITPSKIPIISMLTHS